MFHDDSMKSFFRRLSFTPDGSLLLTPGEFNQAGAWPGHWSEGYNLYITSRVSASSRYNVGYKDQNKSKNKIEEENRVGEK